MSLADCHSLKLHVDSSIIDVDRLTRQSTYLQLQLPLLNIFHFDDSPHFDGRFTEAPPENSLAFMNHSPFHSNHPSATTRVAARSTFAIAVLVGLLSLGKHDFCHAQKPNAGPAPVLAATIQTQTVTSQQTFVGTITPIRSAVIGSAVDGRVQEVMVEEGDLVSPPDGQTYPLVQLQTGTIQIEIDAAQVELKIRQAALEQLKIGIPLEVDEAAANVSAAQSRVKFAKSELERSQRLYQNGGGLSASEMEQALTNYQAETEAFRAATILLDKLKATSETRIQQATSLVNAQQEAIRLLEDRKKKYTIVTPFAGAVTRKIAEVGQWISSGEDVIEVVQLDPIEVTISVPQAQIQALQTSMDQAAAKQSKLPVSVQLDASSSTIQGYVNRIVPQADLMSRAFPVKIRLENPKTQTGHILKPGMLARASISIGASSQKLLVDKDALVLNDQSSSLMIIDRTTSPATIRPTPVQTGQAVGSLIEITGNVKPGDWVVIEGNERLRPNQEVKVLNQSEISDLKSAEKAGEPGSTSGSPALPDSDS